MSLRQSPVRPRRRARPTWLVALLIGVGIVVVLGLGYGILSLVRGDEVTTPPAEASPSPSPCATTLVPVGELLPKPGTVTVNVYNATARSGLASKTATALEDAGFTVGKVDNDPAGAPITGVAQIRFGPKAEEAARLVLAYVPEAELVALKRKGLRVDLAMGDSFTGLASEQQVNDALAVPTPVASGIGCPRSP